MLHGGCCCGAVLFTTPDQAAHSTLCFCEDCRRQSGAPVLAWAMFPSAEVSVDGEACVYPSSESGRRSFCGKCGMGLFFTNAALDRMGMVQVRIAALDDPDGIAPRMQAPTAERVSWMRTAHALPAFERFPGQAPRSIALAAARAAASAGFFLAPESGAVAAIPLRRPR